MEPTQIQPEPPEGTLVENEGVNAGEPGDEGRPDPEAARRGGHPERAQEQVDDAEQAAPGELAGAPGRPAVQDDGGQDGGSIE
ncbi:hypothetical protein ACIB24_02710 [Spongisporangium articulatum]|uniref:Uncharacterized protein n=1 Tax=Spongisporangium articulatum TaxID=3362603 RepID=A0ABW8AHY9_9ACTN